MNYTNLEGKIAIVTGASRRQGIGAAICRALAAQGCDLLFTTFQPFDTSQPHGADDMGPDALLQELREVGRRAERLEIDLSQPDAAEAVLRAAREVLAAPAILVNNAAYSTRDGYEGLTAETLDAHYRVNVRAMALLSAGFATSYKGTSGRIINLTSGQGVGPMPGEIAYATSKGAVEAFTVTFAAEVAHLGITVNAVDPGATDAGWMDDAFKGELAAQMRMGRVGEPDDAARLITFLASAEGAWITGQVIRSRGA